MMLGAGFAWLVSHLVGHPQEPVQTALLGLFALPADLTLRHFGRISVDEEVEPVPLRTTLLGANEGASLFWMPMWCWGALWMLVGSCG